MRKILQRKSFAILIVSLSLSYCGKHKKEDPAAETKTSAPLALLSNPQDPKPTEDPEKKKEEEKQEPEQTPPAAPKPLVRGMTPYDVVQTTPNYGNNNQVQSSLVEEKAEDKIDDVVPAVENKSTKTTATTVANPFHSNKFMGEAYSAVGNQAMIDLINSDQIEKTQLEELLTNYFALLESKDVSQYPLKQRLLDNLNLYTSNAVYAAAMKKRIGTDDLSNTLDDSEMRVFEPLVYNTELLRNLTGYPKSENSLGAHYFDEGSDGDTAKEYTAIYIAKIPYPGSDHEALTEEEKKILDQVALLLETYFESNVPKLQDKIKIVTNVKITDASNGPALLILKYLKEKSPAIASQKVDLVTSSNFLNNQIEILIEDKFNQYGRMVADNFGTRPNPNFGNRKFQKSTPDPEEEIEKQEDKSVNKASETSKQNQQEQIGTGEDSSQAKQDPEIQSDSLVPENKPFFSADQDEKAEGDPIEFIDDWDVQPVTAQDSVSIVENKYLKNINDQLSSKTGEEPRQVPTEEPEFFANPFQNNEKLKSTFLAYDEVDANFHGIRLVRIVETDEIDLAEQKQVVDTYLQLMEITDRDFQEFLPTSQRIANAFDLYNQYPVFREAIQTKMETYLYDIENKNGIKLTDSELNVVVPLLYSLDLNKKLSNEKFQKTISTIPDEIDVYETTDSKTKQTYRVIRLGIFDFSDREKTAATRNRELNVVKNLEFVWTAMQSSSSKSVAPWGNLRPKIVGYSNKIIFTLDNESQQNQEIMDLAQDVKKSLPQILWFDIENRGATNPLPGTKAIDKVNRRVEIVLVRTEVKN